MTKTGQLKCWGTDTHGQTGLGAVRHAPTAVDSSTDWAQVAVGPRHTMALKAVGTLWGFGDNTDGQVTGTATIVTTPTPVDGTELYTAVAVGERHTCAIDTDGALWCWGSHAQGQLGIADTTSVRGTRYRVDDTFPFLKVWAGGVGTCARRTDETRCFGGNKRGELGVPLPGPITFPQLQWTDDWIDGSISPATDRPHSCWVDGTNTVRCAGANDGGRLGTGGSAVTTPTELFFIVAS